ERVIGKYGWIVFLALGLLWLVVGLYQIFLPRELAVEDVQLVLNLELSELEWSSPVAMEFVYWLYGSLGLLKVSWSLFVLAITLTGFRRGEKWAWYTLWLVPALLVSTGLFNTFYIGDASQMLQWIPILSLSLVGLFLPYRKFFPK
ncbi:MAG: hypothetical protein ACFFEF_16945, partial [Candidatus Thorarchaeota archaeon]